VAKTALRIYTYYAKNLIKTRRERMKKFIVILSVFLLGAGLCLLYPSSALAYNFGDYRSVTLTTKAWEALEEGDPAIAVREGEAGIDFQGRRIVRDRPRRIRRVAKRAAHEVRPRIVRSPIDRLRVFLDPGVALSNQAQEIPELFRPDLFLVPLKPFRAQTDDLRAVSLRQP
jgi:hypothetical protein